MASTYLSRTLGTPTNGKKFTISFWAKLTEDPDGNAQEIIAGGTDGSNETFLRYTGSETIQFKHDHSTDTSWNLVTNRVFRDPSAWYHIVAQVDTTQGTASDRVKIYINGVQETSFSTANYPAQNEETFLNVNAAVSIGKTNHATSSYFGGLMSHFHFIDGTAYDASEFGETDSTTGEWKIKTSPSVTYGTNGFFILKDGNSVTDQSGNGNNFTVAGGTLTNTEDCPSNVFCTWNPNFQRATNKFLVLTNGNTFLSSTPSGDCAVSGTLGVSSGKWYWEQITNNPDGSSNAAVIGGIHSAEDWNETPENIFYSNTAGLYSNGNARKDNVDLGNFTSSTLGTDIFGVGLDADNGDMYFWRNGTALNSGNAVITGLDTSKTWIPFAILHGGVRITTSTNFGNGYFGTTAVSSAGTNASGIGIFEYDVPTGYTALSTKGLNL